MNKTKTNPLKQKKWFTSFDDSVWKPGGGGGVFGVLVSFLFVTNSIAELTTESRLCGAISTDLPTGLDCFFGWFSLSSLAFLTEAARCSFKLVACCCWTGVKLVKSIFGYVLKHCMEKFREYSNITCHLFCKLFNWVWRRGLAKTHSQIQLADNSFFF